MYKKNILNIAIISLSGYFLYDSIKSLTKYFKLYKYLNLKKTRIKKIVKLINNFDENKIYKEKINYLNNKQAYIIVNFDSILKNDKYNNIFKIKEKSDPSLINKLKSTFYDFELVDKEDDYFKIKYNNLYNKYNKKFSNINFLNLNNEISRRDYDNIFSFINLIFKNKFNLNYNKIKLTENTYSLYSNSKLFILAKIIFDYKNFKIENIKFIKLSETKKIMKTIFIKKISLKLIVAILSASSLAYFLNKYYNLLTKYYYFKLLNDDKNKIENENLFCIICYINMKNIIFLPCKHLSICEICYELYEEKQKCLICKKKIEDMIILKLIKK